MCVAPGGPRVYVTSNRTGKLTIASGDDRTVLATGPGPGSARDIVLSSDGHRAYVSTSTPDVVVVLDAQWLGADL